MIIKALPSGPFSTNAYIVGCQKTQEAAIIDPGVDSAGAIARSLRELGLKPTKILLTHSHWDHTGNVAEVKETYNIPVFIHPLDSPNLERPGSDGLPLFVPIRGVAPDYFFEDGGTVSVGSHTFLVIHTPGHTPGGVCLYCQEEAVLFSGDTLFKQSIGNLGFPGAQPEKMWSSLKKLEKLPPQTEVYPGHGSSTTIGDEEWLPRAKEIFG